MPRHAKPAAPRRSPHVALAGAAIAAAILLTGTATATAVAPAGNVDDTTLLECKPIEQPAATSTPAPVTSAPTKPSKPSPAPGKPPLDTPPATTTPAETPTDTPAAPVEGDGTTAAEVHGWGAPIPEASDDFNAGSLDTAKWSVYDSEGHDGNGTRSPSQVTVEDGALVLSGDEAGNSAGMASTFDQQYGRWEARVRTETADPNGSNQYHPLLIIWPESNQWPAHGEYDFFENSAPGLDHIEAFLHYPGHTPKRQEHAELAGVDTTQWQNIAFEWTPDHLKGFVNGEEWFSFSEHDITGMPSGHLTIQLDNFHGSGMTEARYEIDSVRTYALN